MYGIRRTTCCSSSYKVLDVSTSTMEKENSSINARNLSTLQVKEIQCRSSYVLVMWFSVLGAGVVVVIFLWSFVLTVALDLTFVVPKSNK